MKGHDPIVENQGNLHLNAANFNYHWQGSFLNKTNTVAGGDGCNVQRIDNAEVPKSGSVFYFLEEVIEKRVKQEMKMKQRTDNKLLNDCGKPRAKLDGVGFILKQIRGEIAPLQKNLIFGLRERDPLEFPVCRVAEVQQALMMKDRQRGIDRPNRDIPSDFRLVRKMIRQNMIRCKVCKNRFGEKNIYERHLRDKHPDAHAKYIEQQEDETELQRLEDLEDNQHKALKSRGFIIPEEETWQPGRNPNLILLPGEKERAEYDFLHKLGQLERPYKKKDASPQCPFCDKRFHNEMCLKKHFEKEHADMTEFRQCLKCYKCVKDERELAYHYCDLTYSCFECIPMRNMYSESRLLKHRHKFHRGANSGFRCDKCNEKFLTPRKLRNHKKTTHALTKTYQCYFCDQVFISTIDVIYHERLHTKTDTFHCNACNYIANRYCVLLEHKKNKHGPICPIPSCRKRSIGNDELRQHVYDKHGGYLAASQPLSFY